MPRDKEKQKEYLRLYNMKNKDKKKEYHRLYNKANKDKIKERKRLYGIANKDKIKEYHIANKDKIKEKQDAYRQTPQGKKNVTMRSWRSRGINNVDDELYNKYINTHCCDVCSKEFKNSLDRHLDHNHDTGDFRQILCRACNTHDSWKKKKIEA